MMVSVSLAEFARIMGVDRSQPTRWVAAGMPLLPDGRVDAETASEWVRNNIDPSAARTARYRARESVDPVAGGVRLGLAVMAAFAPRAVAEAAVTAGIPIPLARALTGILVASTDNIIERCVVECGLGDVLPSADSGLPVCEEEVFPVDWEFLEARATATPRAIG